jgi:hypothetical protein
MLRRVVCVCVCVYASRIGSAAQLSARLLCVCVALPPLRARAIFITAATVLGSAAVQHMRPPPEHCSLGREPLLSLDRR